MFDPDYRYKPWNRSSFAPKNRRGGPTMTQLAGGIAALAFIPVYAILPENIALYGAGIAAGITFLMAGVTIRRRAWRAINQQLEIESSTQRSQKLEKEFVQDTGESHSERGSRFEREVAQLINISSGYKALVVGGAGDGGADIHLYSGSILKGVVQCKHYKGVVAPMYVRELATVKQQYQVDIAYLFTTGRFSDSTRKEAENLGIRLVDGEALQRLRDRSAERIDTMRRKDPEPSF